MSTSSDARAIAIALGRRMATNSGLHLCALFADTFSGDLARMRARAHLRRMFPAATAAFIEQLIEEYLTP